MKQGAYLPPRILQGVGVALLVGQAILYYLTTPHTVSALLVGAALSLIGLGAYSGLHVSIRQELMHEAAERDRSNGA